MSDFKFLCPLCNQKIQCDEQLSGQQIGCPACGGGIVIPQSSAPQAPPPPPQPTRISVAALPVRPGPGPAAPSRPAPPPGRPMPGQTENKSGRLVQIGIWAGVILALATGIYFAFPMMMEWQRNINASREEAAKDSDGGELGHIAELHSVLNATDPARFDSDPGSGGGAPRERVSKTANLPVVAPAWTLDAGNTKIAASRLNGSIAGEKFLPDMIRIDSAGGAQILTFRQGTNVYADREIVIYLRIKPGETLERNSWTVTKEMSPGVPQVIERWRADPRYAPKQRLFNSGYGMQLEFEKTDGRYLPGRIFLALPNPEQTVVAGVFEADLYAPPLPGTRARSRGSDYDYE